MNVTETLWNIFGFSVFVQPRGSCVAGGVGSPHVRQHSGFLLLRPESDHLEGGERIVGQDVWIHGTRVVRSVDLSWASYCCWKLRDQGLDLTWDLSFVSRSAFCVCWQWTRSAGVPTTLAWSWPVAAQMEPFPSWRSPGISSGTSRSSAHTLWVWRHTLDWFMCVSVC